LHKKTGNWLGHGICKKFRAMTARKHQFRDIGIYSGAGAGIALFALYGFLPSSFIGGVVGLNMLGGGTVPVQDGAFSRIIVGVFMVLSVILMGFLSGFIGSVLGRFIGSTLDRLPTARGAVSTNSSNANSRIHEKRQVSRAPVSTVVRVEAKGKNCIADVNDISEKGARLSFLNSSFTPIESGQRLICRLPGNVVRESRVVWTEESSSECRVGIEFIDDVAHAVSLQEDPSP